MFGNAGLLVAMCLAACVVLLAAGLTLVVRGGDRQVRRRADSGDGTHPR